MPPEILTTIEAMLIARRTAQADKSYVATLYQKGTDHILKKIGEEAAEVIIAAKTIDPDARAKAVIYEMADLWFHSMVLLCEQNLSIDEVMAELARRQGLSGLVEKAARVSSGEPK